MNPVVLLLPIPPAPAGTPPPDPLYFDFISCAQYATISNELGRPQRSFQEYVEVCPPGAGDDDPCDGSTQLVTRPAQFADDAKLASYFYEVAGGQTRLLDASLHASSMNHS